MSWTAISSDQVMQGVGHHDCGALVGGKATNTDRCVRTSGHYDRTPTLLRPISNVPGLKEYSAWPTFPQIYIGGEFFGGCDIMLEAHNNGELAKVLDEALEEA